MSKKTFFGYLLTVSLIVSANTYQLTDTFKSPNSQINDQELSSAFKTPKSLINDQQLSNSFKKPNSKFNDYDGSELNKRNILSGTILDFDENYSFWLAVHCHNIDSIAGFQFELPSDLELIDILGSRSEDAGFQLHYNDNGLILGFSMSGETIPQLITDNDKQNSTIFKLHLKAKQDAIFSFPIKAILAGPKGEKLSFKSINNELSINNQSITISFYE